MTAEHSTASEKKAKLAAYQKAYREANREKQRAYMASYYAVNKERMSADAAARYRADPASYKARAIKWVKENPARRHEITDKWRKEHPEIYVASARRGYIKHRPKRIAECKEYRQNNGPKMRALNAAWHEKNPEANAHHVGLRRTRKLQAQPLWADVDAIRAIYKEAARLKKATGLAFHVDHVIPLKHPLVCGLHVHTNLRVIPAADNMSKGNRLFD